MEAYRQALVYRPAWPDTYLWLGYALKDAGRLEEAFAAWEEVLRLDPANQAARDELERLRPQESRASRAG